MPVILIGLKCMLAFRLWPFASGAAEWIISIKASLMVLCLVFTILISNLIGVAEMEVPLLSITYICLSKKFFLA
jgi:hypothetical protein